MRTKTLLTIVAILFMAVQMIGQGYFPDDLIQQKNKQQGKIPLPAQVVVMDNAIEMTLLEGNRTAGLLVPLDGSFTQLLPRNDDGSFGPFTLPFTFCFYGVPQTTFYVNNNGNVSFGSPFSTFTSTGFPVGGYPMLAPFWADVDTRPTGGGDVWLKMTANRVVVIWDHVGYFSLQTDKLNTFELVMTDGNDGLIGINKNVAFSYDDMQWTTGSASGGVGGFGGTPATVGINKGDGVLYALIGRFDHEGTDYDGAGGNADGVSYLDFHTWIFNACEENPVINAPLSTWAIFLGLGLIVVGAMLRYRRII